MKQKYLIQDHYPRLLLFFAGWGADATPFQEYRPQGCDFQVCYDYRTLDMDTTGWECYQEIHVVGWSMGVWAATQLIQQKRWTQGGRRIAINGTPYPMDDLRGIPETIFRGTLEGLTDVSLHKFLRRMCADSTAFRQFLEVTPRRPLEELREELSTILTTIEAEGYPSEVPAWDEAVVGSADRIIPPANQLAAWQSLHIPVRTTEDAHYDQSLFKHYLNDLWTND